MRFPVFATAAIACSLALGAAQAASPAAPNSSKPAPGPDSGSKASISKSCSVQADSQGLHGKARKKFRSECKRHGGKMG